MGISAGTLRLLAHTVAERRLSGAAVTLGVQGVESDYEQLLKVLTANGIPHRSLEPAARRIDSHTQWKGNISQDTLFRVLGFDSVDSIDYFADEAPTHQLDLNEPLPAALAGRYDLVYDGGTLEHCFDIRSVLGNCVRLLRAGGTVIHHVPLSGNIDHGFYQFSPTLFFDFYSENGFTDLDLKIHFLDGHRELYATYDYRHQQPFPGNFDYGSRYLFFSARRTSVIEPVRIPIQNRYRQMFGDRKVEASGRSVPKVKFHRRLLSILFPRFHRGLIELEHFLKNRRRSRRRIEQLKRLAVIAKPFREP